MHIDFGNGHTLDRTLNGNIAFWFVTPEGEAFDLVPGIVDVPTFLHRCGEAANLGSLLAELRDPAQRLELVVEEHFARTLLSPQTSQAAVPDRGKRLVEFPIKLALASEKVFELLHEGEPSSPAPRVGLADLAKSGVELPLKHGLGASAGAPFEASGLAEDTQFNQRERFPKADHLLCEWPLQPPASLTEHVYGEILGVDLADPYLGLAPYLLGGEPGRDGAGLAGH
ncbi:MAG TPA: hypothetical protein VM509_14255 [Planctomycetota bacterium]|nr:hypothetical protein [Planctomycetota bacterium]